MNFFAIDILEVTQAHWKCHSLLHSASEVTTLWRYTNLFIIISIIILDPSTQFPGNEKNYAVQYKKVQKSSWNEPYSSSSFTKQSCSKMALYR